MSKTDTISSIPTPALILDEARMLRNIARLGCHLDSLDVPIRPHLKTVKSIDAARRILPGETAPQLSRP